ncbi:hypothetical protein G210_5334 [Candida maltosa Xu316]|uniref:Uncharacterized protein n=1 Tax=Candida maltosa (strain Xu316) TaxID=1245528 RepID=M3K4Z3_CANMX|nr:hypothetical protein G210_5334 [Candida maltosa Xu316]
MTQPSSITHTIIEDQTTIPRTPILKASPLQDLPINKITNNNNNTSPSKPQMLSSASKKRGAVSPMAQHQPVRRKIEIDQYGFGFTEVEIELNYANWLLQQQLNQAKELKEFLQLEREFSK